VRHEGNPTINDRSESQPIRADEVLELAEYFPAWQTTLEGALLRSTKAKPTDLPMVIAK
jgi:hypothetical protein